MTLPVMQESSQLSTLAGRRVLSDVQGLCSELSWLVGKAPDLLFTPGPSDCSAVHPTSGPSGLEGMWFDLGRRDLLALGSGHGSCVHHWLRPHPQLSISSQHWSPQETLHLDSSSTPRVNPGSLLCTCRPGGPGGGQPSPGQFPEM